MANNSKDILNKIKECGKDSMVKITFDCDGNNKTEEGVVTNISQSKKQITVETDGDEWEIDFKDVVDIEIETNLTQNEIDKSCSYFKILSDWWYFLIVVMILMAIGCESIGAKIFCIAVLGLAGYVIYHNKTSVTDAEFDAIVEKAKHLLENVALNKLGIDSSDLVRKSLLIDAPRYYNRAGAQLIFKEGKDGFLRYSLHHITFFCFTKKHLAMYRCAFDFQTGNRLNEQTEEFFYKDVVSVGVTTESSTVMTDVPLFKTIRTAGASSIDFAQSNEWQTFVLRNAGAGTIEVPMRNEKLLQQMGGKLEETEIDKIVNCIRAILRDEK